MSIELSGFPLLIVLLVILLPLLAIFGSRYEKRRMALIKRQAKKRRGEYFQNGRWELELPFNGDTVYIQRVMGNKYEPSMTSAVYRPNDGFLVKFEVQRTTLFQRIATVFGKERVLLEDDFDKRFVVRGDDPLMMRRIINAETRTRLMKRPPYWRGLRVNSQYAQIDAAPLALNDEAYDNFIETAFLIFQKIPTPIEVPNAQETS